MHFLLTGPNADGRKVIGDRLRLDVQDLRVGLELGLGEKERLVGTAICIEGEKHCFPVTQLEEGAVPPPLLPPLVGEGEGEGDVRGEGNGPTPMVRGSMGSQVLFDVGGCCLASLLSLRLRSSQDWDRFFSKVSPRWISRSVAISSFPRSLVSSTLSRLSRAQPALWLPLPPPPPGLTGLTLVLHRRHLLDADR